MIEIHIISISKVCTLIIVLSYWLSISTKKHEKIRVKLIRALSFSFSQYKNIMAAVPDRNNFHEIRKKREKEK